MEPVGKLFSFQQRCGTGQVRAVEVSPLGLDAEEACPRQIGVRELRPEGLSRLVRQDRGV